MVKNVLDLNTMKTSLQSQQEIIQSQIVLVEETQALRDEVKQTAQRTERRLHKIETTYPMLDTEADRLQSIATIKAHQFTSQFFGEEVSQELYMKKFGHLISGIYRSVKKEFHVRKYTLVLHVEADQAIAFVENLTLKDLPQNYMRLTDSQIDTAARHGDYNVLEKLG